MDLFLIQRASRKAAKFAKGNRGGRFKPECCRPRWAPKERPQEGWWVLIPVLFSDVDPTGTAAQPLKPIRRSSTVPVVVWKVWITHPFQA